MSQIRIGVVGAGRFGRAHIEAYRRSDRAEIVGVVDARRENADRAAAAYGVPVFDSVGAMLRQARPHAVSIVVPAALRDALVDDIAGFGAAVLIEKPLASDGPVAAAVASRWGAGPVMVGHVVRFAAPYRRLLGELGARQRPDMTGRCSRIRGRDHLDMYPTEDVVGLTLVHDIDAAHWFSGSYASAVRATGLRSADGRWSDVTARLAMPSGAVWTLRSAWSGDDEDQICTAGMDLVIAQDRSGLVADGVEIASWAGSGTVYDEALRAELDHFLDCAIGGNPSGILRLTDAAAVVRVVDAVRASLARGGEPVVPALP